MRFIDEFRVQATSAPLVQWLYLDYADVPDTSFTFQIFSEGLRSEVVKGSTWNEIVQIGAFGVADTEPVVFGRPFRAVGGTGGTITFAHAPPSVPGPLPLFGAAAAFGYSRKLRKRIKVAAGSVPYTNQTLPTNRGSYMLHSAWK